MTPETFAEWLRRLGHRVIRTRSSYWFDAGPRVYQAFPYHWVVRPEEEELLELLNSENAIGLRYSTPMDAPIGACSYHIVFEQASYGLPEVEASVRGQVRKGLGACQIGPIPLERFAREGWALQQDTQGRQGRRSRHGSARWTRMVEAAADLEGFAVWGAEVEGRLAASIMYLQMDDTINLLYQQSLREYLPLRVNSALAFELTRAQVARPEIRLIHYGLHSLDAPATIDQFKLRLGYKAKPVLQRVMFHPRLAPLLGPGAAGLLDRLAVRLPGFDVIRKSEGLLRFYLNGKLPLERQVFPVNLALQRDALCLEQGSAAWARMDWSSSPGSRIQVSPATPADLDELVRLHLHCFSKDEHLVLKLGPRFLGAVYRWFLTSPETMVLVARLGARIVGFTALASRPYNLPMLRACKWAALLGILRRPWLLLHSEWLRRLFGGLSIPTGAPGGKVAQIAFTGVDHEFQGQGIGRMLKDASIRVCRAWGAASVVTGIHRENHRAKALNIQAGFVEVPEASTRELTRLRLDLISGGDLRRE